MLLSVPALMVARKTVLSSGFSIPADRRIDWNPAGLDVIGGIPDSHAFTTTIAGLDPTGATDSSAIINAAISASAYDTLLLIPAGVYLVAGQINMKNGVTLRGAKPFGAPFMPAADPSATTLKVSGNNRIFFRGGDKTHNWYPGVQLGIAITAGYSRGSDTLTIADASALSVNDYIVVYQNKDTTWVEDKGLNYVGEDSGPDPHVWSQYTQITNISGNVITIDPPLYQVTPSPTGQSVRKQTFGVTHCGVENMRFYGDNTCYRPIWMQFCQFCWVKGCEMYQTGGTVSDGSPHIWTEFCYANEYRRNYCHVGGSHDSGCDYGMEFFHWNGRHKIEDNIIMETRHSILLEGGSGCVVLYNFMDDNWESVQGFPLVRDDNFLSEDAVTCHAAHPYMNLWEGNRAANWWGDFTQGSSSHNTCFRNAFLGKQTSYSLNSSPFLWDVIEIEQYNRYFNVIGNILGNSSFTGGTLIDDNTPGPFPEIYRFGWSSTGGSYQDTQSYSTAILHGNYDYVTNSVAHWAGDHQIPLSLYYAAKPSFFGSMAWPPFDSGDPANNARDRIPAGYRFLNGTDPP